MLFSSGWIVLPPCIWIEDMLKFSGLVVASLSVFALAACGGSGGGGHHNRAPSFEELSTRNAEMQTRVNALAETATMPTTGTATYLGTGAFDTGRDGSADMLADLALQANFATNTVGGKFTNFAGADGRRIGGDVTIQDSVANRNAFESRATGTLVDGGAKDVDVIMNGVFRGDKAQAVGGQMNGTIDGDALGGSFVAEKR